MNWGVPPAQFIIGAVSGGQPTEPPVPVILCPSCPPPQTPQNDDFANAILLPPDMVATNVPFELLWASAETDEPPRRTTPAVSSLWWKWTPGYSGRVRLKAVGSSGVRVPLDVFLGSDLLSLRRIVNNDRSRVAPGRSGLIYLPVRAGKTYFIRVDYFAGLPRGLGGLPGTLTIEPANAPLKAELYLSQLRLGPKRHGQSSIQVAWRVYLPDRQTPVTTSNYRAQVYVGRRLKDLRPVGPEQTFLAPPLSDDVPDLSGVIAPALVTLPGIQPYARVRAQVRVWDADHGDSYETAQANGGQFGASRVHRVVTGSEVAGPGNLLGIKSFALSEGGYY